MIMKLENMTGEEIVNTELSTGVPIVYRLDKDGKHFLSSSSLANKLNLTLFSFNNLYRQGSFQGSSEPRVKWIFDVEKFRKGTLKVSLYRIFIRKPKYQSVFLPNSFPRTRTWTSSDSERKETICVCIIAKVIILVIL
jgi:hypothetical protein